jgi:hypothetical protein
MKKIDWEKLCYSFILGLLLSICIVLLGVLIVVCIELICTSFELGALIITFILLVTGLTYWVYKEES